MCHLAFVVIAGVMHIQLVNCAAESRACQLYGYIYGTTEHARCVEILSHMEQGWRRL
jgi:hypothetical protein